MVRQSGVVQTWIRRFQITPEVTAVHWHLVVDQLIACRVDTAINIIQPGYPLNNEHYNKRNVCTNSPTLSSSSADMDMHRKL